MLLTFSKLRSLGLFLALSVGATAGLVHCSAAEEGGDDEQSEDAITGVNNSAGLALTYDKDSKHVRATLSNPLAEGESLRIRVRRGTIKHESQAELNCEELKNAPALGSAKNVGGKVVYDGPAVSEELVKLISLYNDPRWYGGGETPEMRAELDKGPDSIVEACVMSGDKVKAKLLTNLAYAWDRGEDLAKGVDPSGVGQKNLHLLAGDAGLNGGQGGPVLPEGQSYNTIDYGRLCVQEMGEIPFFKKIAEGKYETFDCRDFKGSNGSGAAVAINGVTGAIIPLSKDGEAVTKCNDPTNMTSTRSYDCVDKCDNGMYLTASSSTNLGGKASCQPGVTVTTAENAQGTSWVLLCRKVEDTGVGMLKTKRFNDIAIVGNNPKTGKTCFFQNKENVGNDGSRVTHPADVARSSAIWPAQPSSYCTGSCHASDAFVHSPWIDMAKRPDGTPIVPKMGEHPNFPISDLELPYKLVNGPAQGFQVPKQLVSEDALPCTSCHRIAGKAFAEFAEWSTGTGNSYFKKITASHSSFPEAFWMPQRLDGYTAESFASSRWMTAVKHIRNCLNPLNGVSAPGCEFADIPQTRRTQAPTIEPPAAGPIGEDILRTVTKYEVVAQELNCRSGAGTSNPIVTVLLNGTTVTVPAASASQPRILTDQSTGKKWLLVKSGESTCYASAQYQFLSPR